MWDLLSTKIDLPASIVKPYEGFIFLCGGPTDVKSHVPISIRDAIYRELVKHPEIEKRIKVAEHYKDWAHDSIYQDLVLFERHLAEISSVIVLSLESPGSIAELGLFSVISEFQSKLIIFVDTTHYQSQSFIKLGPINFLEKVHGNNAHCQQWLKKAGENYIFDADAAVKIQSEMADAVLERANKLTKEHVYRRDSWFDDALLLCDFLNLCSALTLREIKKLFADFEIQKTETDLRQTLYLLEKVGLIAMQPKGDQRFFVARDSRQFFQFHLRDRYFDFLRFRNDLLRDYEKNDKRRYHAVLEARKKYA